MVVPSPRLYAIKIYHNRVFSLHSVLWGLRTSAFGVDTLLGERLTRLNGPRPCRRLDPRCCPRLDNPGLFSRLGGVELRWRFGGVRLCWGILFDSIGFCSRRDHLSLRSGLNRHRRRSCYAAAAHPPCTLVWLLTATSPKNQARGYLPFARSGPATFPTTSENLSHTLPTSHRDEGSTFQEDSIISQTGSGNEGSRARVGRSGRVPFVMRFAISGLFFTLEYGLVPVRT